MSVDPHDIDALCDRLKGHEKIMFFTGAGISVDSGIPDFRSGDGIWNRIDPMTLSQDRLMGRTGTVDSFWSGMHEIWRSFGTPEPNRSHQAVAALQQTGKVLGVVTQNIDGLHQQAGSRNVIELHGNQRACVCMACARTEPMQSVMARVADGCAVPTCLHCDGPIRPQIVLFGDPLPWEEMNRAQSMACEADLCVVLGSSLVVYPAADLPRIAYASGAQLVIVTMGDTPLNGIAHLHVDAPLLQSFVPAVERYISELSHAAN